MLHVTRPHMRMDVALFTGTRITGRVLEPSRQPIVEAKVVCLPRFAAFLAPMRRAPVAREATSGSDGIFELAGIPPGNYQVFAHKDGYRFELKGVPVYPDGRSPIDNVEVILRRVTDGDHVVFGVVRDVSGAPVPGARVGLAVLGLDSLSMGGRDTESGADGAFRFEGVGEGEWLLVVEKPGYRQATDAAIAGREARIELERCSSVSGVVKRPDGTPANAFSVRVVGSVGSEGSPSVLARFESLGSTHAFQDAAGRFRLADVPPGRILLEAAAPGCVPGRLEIDVPRGQPARDVVLHLSAAGATVRGQATTVHGAPIRGARVTVIEQGGVGGLIALAADGVPRAPEATTDERGAFSLARLAPASYEVHVTHPGYAPSRVKPVVVRSDETVDVIAVLKGGGSIEGHTRPGVMITVAGDAFSVMLASDEAGDFRIDRVPGGEYLVRAVVMEERSTKSAPTVHRRTVHVEDGQVTRIDFGEAQTQVRTVEGRIESPARGTLAMVLLRLPGSPAPDPADVLFQGQLGESRGEASRYVVAEGLVQNDGTFKLQGVPPGRYTRDVYVTTVLGTLAGKRATLIECKEVVID
jgi:hypothetical protein